MPSVFLGAELESPQLTSISVGLGGHAKVGYWTPVHLSVQAGARPFRGQITVEAPDADGVPTRFRQALASRIEIVAGGTWTGWRYVKIGRMRAPVHVTLRNDDGSQVRSTSVGRVSLSEAMRPWGLVVGQNIGIREAASRLVRQQQGRLMISRLDKATDFPDRWYGYEGVDTLLMCTSDLHVIDNLSSQQFSAMREWVRMGGRLILSASANASELFAEGGRLYDLRPGDYDEMNPYWKATGLEAFARSATRLLNPDLVPIPVFTNYRGQVICHEGIVDAGDTPLILRYAYGFGDITFLALDLDAAPLSKWAGRSHLLARLLRFEDRDERGGNENSGLGRVSHVGFEDLTGQLRGCLEQFDGITLVRFSWIAGILALYLLLIGPTDYFLLRKLHRPQWTWVTFPLYVVLFCVFAVMLAQHWKGHSVRANQVDLVDVDVARSWIRGTTWINLYSPNAVAADVRMTPKSPLASMRGANVLMSWQGLPGTGLGGMNTTGSVGQLNDRYTIFVENDTSSNAVPFINSLPVHSSSTKSVIGRWWANAEPSATGSLTTSVDGFLHGQVVNPLDVEIDHCAVYFGNWVYRLDRRLAPGEEADLDVVSPLDLKWQLTRRQFVNSNERVQPWDRTDFSDVPRMMEMIMFHDAAGGRQFTHLAHRYQSFADLSAHLHMGQAILIGTSASLATQLETSIDRQLDGHLRHWTYYRVVLPVKLQALR